MLKKYNILHLPAFSFFSKRMYRDLGQNWSGANFAYLFLLLALCLIPPTLQKRKQALHVLNDGKISIMNQIPKIDIKNGNVIVDQTKPIYIKGPKNIPIAIIDTTGSMNYIDDNHTFALLTETELILRTGKNKFNTVLLPQDFNLHIDKQVFNTWQSRAEKALPPLLYGIALLLSYTFTVLTLLLASVVGLIIAKSTHTPLRYGAIVRIASAAVTPSIILLSITASFGETVPGIAHILLTAVYLLLGIQACKEEGQKVPILSLNTLLKEGDLGESTHTRAA